MKDKTSVHLKVQELCDCFAANNPLEEMSKLTRDEDKEEAALKWLALAVLHGVSAGAEKVSLSVRGGENALVEAEYRKAQLPSPGGEIGAKIIEAVRDITHFDKDKAKGPLALGIRNDSLEIRVKVSKDGDKEKLTLKFPD